jgi:hypothetical protein
MVSTRKRGNSSALDELWRWLGFSVVLGLFPLAMRFLHLRARAPSNASVWSTVQSTLGEGELFLISCCIAGAAIGERAGRHAMRTRVELFFYLWCLLDMVGCGFYYALAVTSVANTGAVATLSFRLFILSVI